MVLVSERFMAAIDRRDVAGALALCDSTGSARLPHSTGPGNIGDVVGPYLDVLVAAFPDLHVRIRHPFALSGGVEVVEANFEGTQAADFLGIVNQEKHADIDQAWRFTVADGRITSVRAYWCQNMVFRRLGVRRLDETTITDAVVATLKGAAA